MFPLLKNENKNSKIKQTALSQGDSGPNSQGEMTWLDSLRLLAMIKNLVYTRGTHDLHVHHNTSMAQTNLTNLRHISRHTRL